MSLPEVDKGYSSHGEWSTIGKIRELEVERGNKFPSLREVERLGFEEGFKAIWITYRKKDALRYALPASEWDRVGEGKLTDEEKEMLKDIVQVDIEPTDKILFEDDEGGGLLVRPPVGYRGIFRPHKMLIVKCQNCNFVYTAVGLGMHRAGKCPECGEVGTHWILETLDSDDPKLEPYYEYWRKKHAGDFLQDEIQPQWLPNVNEAISRLLGEYSARRKIYSTPEEQEVKTFIHLNSHRIIPILIKEVYQNPEREYVSPGNVQMYLFKEHFRDIVKDRFDDWADRSGFLQRVGKMEELEKEGERITGVLNGIKKTSFRRDEALPGEPKPKKTGLDKWFALGIGIMVTGAVYGYVVSQNE